MHYDYIVYKATESVNTFFFCLGSREGRVPFDLHPRQRRVRGRHPRPHHQPRRHPHQRQRGHDRSQLVFWGEKGFITTFLDGYYRFQSYFTLQLNYYSHEFGSLKSNVKLKGLNHFYSCFIIWGVKKSYTCRVTLQIWVLKAAFHSLQNSGI